MPGRTTAMAAKAPSKPACSRRCRSGRAIDNRRERARIVYRLFRIDGPDRAGEFRPHLRGIGTRAHDQGHAVLRALLERKVDLRPSVLVDAVVANVANDANDGHPAIEPG